MNTLRGFPTPSAAKRPLYVRSSDLEPPGRGERGRMGIAELVAGAIVVLAAVGGVAGATVSFSPAPEVERAPIAPAPVVVRAVEPVVEAPPPAPEPVVMVPEVSAPAPLVARPRRPSRARTLEAAAGPSFDELAARAAALAEPE